MAKITSEKFSFKGWNFKAWILGNGETIKEVVKIGAPLAAGWFATSGNVVLSGFIGIVGKFVLDSVEYFMKQY